MSFPEDPERTRRPETAAFVPDRKDPPSFSPNPPLPPILGPPELPEEQIAVAPPIPDFFVPDRIFTPPTIFLAPPREIIQSTPNIPNAIVPDRRDEDTSSTTVQSVTTTSSPLPSMSIPTIEPFLIDRISEPVPLNQLNTSTISDLLNGTLTQTFTNTTQPFMSGLCGFPGICYPVADSACADTELGQCSYCPQSSTVVFLLVVVLGALAIVVGNGLILMTYKFTKKMNKPDIIKCSVAFADFLSGLQIFAVAIPNVSTTLSSTSRELDMLQLSYRGSTAATVGGIFFVFTFTSSLYHLVYFSQQRLYALVSPINYKLQTKKAIYLGLLITWLLAAVAASVPAWFPDQFIYTYFHTTFFFYPALLNSSAIGTGAAALAVFTILPFVLMVSIIIATAILLKKAITRQSKLVSIDETKQQSSVFVTFAIMTIGFTITLLPIIIVVALFYAGVLNCDNLGTPYLICFYLSMANSLVNVIVYSLRDHMFRKRVKTWLSSCAGSSAGKMSPTLSKPTGKTGLTKTSGQSAGDKRNPRISSSEGSLGSGLTKSSSDRNESSSTVLPMSP